MKIKVKDLVANPFREIGKYPIDKAKIASLERSINDTFFWNNVICRKKGQKYEIAYGHHRLIALRNLDIKEVDIPCMDLTDSEMIRIMAEENLEWLTSPLVIYQTVISVKKFLDAEIAKYDTWDEFRSDKSIRPIIQSEPVFRSVKGKGVGRSTILKFLGSNWRSGMIQPACQAFAMVEEGKLDMNATLEFESIDQARQFQKAVKDYDIPLEKQAEIATKVKKNLEEKKTVSGHFPQSQMTIEEDISKQIGKKKNPQAKQNEMKRIINALTTLEKQARILTDRMMALRTDIKKLGVEEMVGLKPALAKFALKRLNKEMEIWKGEHNACRSGNNRRIDGNVIN